MHVGSSSFCVQCVLASRKSVESRCLGLMTCQCPSRLPTAHLTAMDSNLSFSPSLSFCLRVAVISATTQRSRLQPGGRRAGKAERRRDRATEGRTLPAEGETGPHVPAGETRRRGDEQAGDKEELFCLERELCTDTANKCEVRKKVFADVMPTLHTRTGLALPSCGLLDHCNEF